MLHDYPCLGPTAIRTRIGAILFVTSLTPGNGERMSQYNLKAGDVGGLLTPVAG
jgi:hypothetical protein